VVKHFFTAIILFFILLAGCTADSQTPSSGASPPDAAKNASIKSTDIYSLMKTNSPLECSIRLDYQGATLFSTIYIKGGSYKYVLPISALNPQMGNIEMIYNNSSIYMKVPNISGVSAKSDCIWLSMPADGEGTPPASSPSDFAGAKFDCKNSSFGDEMFRTEGKICTEREMGIPSAGIAGK